MFHYMTLQLSIIATLGPISTVFAWTIVAKETIVYLHQLLLMDSHEWLSCIHCVFQQLLALSRAAWALICMPLVAQPYIAWQFHYTYTVCTSCVSCGLAMIYIRTAHVA